MLAFSREIITIERVTQCVRRFTTFNASSELPSDLEDAILFWINKVCVTVQQNVDKTQTGPDGSDTSQKVLDMSLCLRKPTIWVPTRSETNQPVQSQKMVRGWKFWI